MQKDHAAQRGRDAFGPATRISASLLRRLSAFFESTPGQDLKAAKFAVLPPGHAGFPNRAKRSEGSDTTPTSYTQRVLSAGCTSHNSDKSKKRLRSPAGPRRLRNSDAHKRIAAPKAFCVLQEHPRPSPKSGKVCRFKPRPRRVSETCETVRG